MIDHEIKKQIIENVGTDLNEFLNIHFENPKFKDLISDLTDQDIEKIKLEIYKVLNNQDEFIYILKNIYENTLSILYHNDLDPKNDNDLDLLNEIFYDNYFLCFNIEKIDHKIDIDYMGIYGKEDQGSIDKIQISIPSAIDYL